MEVGGYNRFSRVAGTSAGAVVGCVVAAGSAKGKTAADIVKLLQQDLDEADFSSFVDGQGFLNPFALGHLLALNKGEVIKDWLRKQLQTALDSDEEPTFGALNTGNRGVQPAANSPAFLVFLPLQLLFSTFTCLHWHMLRYDLLILLSVSCLPCSSPSLLVRSKVENIKQAL